MSESPSPSRPRRPKKDLDALLRQTAEAEAAKNTVIPPLSPDEELELKAKQSIQVMNHDHMVLAEILHQVYTEKLWERRGYADAPDYFEDQLGIGYRTAMRAISIWDAHLALPEVERPEARKVLEGIGVNKASIVAPAIKEQPLEWTKWTQSAREMSREALQEQVTKARGLPPKNGTAGDRLFNTFVSRLTKEQREEFEEIYRAGKAVAESDDFVVITTLAFIEAGPAWIQQADRIRGGHGNA